MLASCSISVTSLPPQPQQPAEVPPTPFPDTPAPAAIDAPLLESPALTSVHFLNELDGWGVTETQVVRTNDGGITWYNVTPPDITETGFSVEVFVLDQDHVWMQRPDFENYPNGGFLHRTADGGITWMIFTTPFSGGDIHFLDATRGWMLADLGVGAGSNAVAVFQTTDGGETWNRTYTNDPNNSDASDSLPLGGLKSGLIPINMQTAWVGGVVYSPGTVYLYRTDDGGQTWAQVSLPLPEGTENSELSIDVDQMQFATARDGYLVLRMSGETTQTAFYVTRDGGATWTLRPTLIPQAGSSDFLSAEEVILYNGDQFYVTHDAGQTWNTVTPDIVFGDSFAGMDFVNVSSGWVITMDPAGHRALYRTTDGGVTWLPVIP